MFVIFENVYGGRLGNAIFRYFACVLYIVKYGYKYTTQKVNPQFIVKHSNFLDYLNGKKSIPASNLTMSEFYQMENIYTNNKEQIIKYIQEYKDSDSIFTDLTEDNKEYKIKEIIDTPGDFDKYYDMVIHVRLEDFVESKQNIDIDKILDLLNDLIFDEGKVCIVLNKIKTDFEKDYIDKLLEWFKTKELDVSIESNDIITDFHIMKNAKTLICSNSTISWCAAFLSEKIETCYMPDYEIRKDRPYQTFKHPIKNTIMYKI